ncbi:MAG: hypothetical protein EZS28_000096 [Streblomastix strix]|uniref:Uncharacterized protein n=1 Tax=Streblomastix strix TaxID=222440 RepID=A0A5J4XCY1_9EUKA|nr:MAG: hypothetical protein EZS28_000096 [Streblomastix strix]
MEAIKEGGDEDNYDEGINQQQRKNMPEYENIVIDLQYPRIKPADGKLTKVAQSQVDDKPTRPIMLETAPPTSIQNQGLKINRDYQQELMTKSIQYGEIALRPRRHDDDNVFERLYQLHEDQIVKNIIEQSKEIQLAKDEEQKKLKLKEPQKKKIRRKKQINQNEDYMKQGEDEQDQEEWEEIEVDDINESALRLYSLHKERQNRMNLIREQQEQVMKSMSIPQINPDSKEIAKHLPPTQVKLAFKRAITPIVRTRQQKEEGEKLARDKPDPEQQRYLILYRKDKEIKEKIEKQRLQQQKEETKDLGKPKLLQTNDVNQSLISQDRGFLQRNQEWRERTQQRQEIMKQANLLELVGGLPFTPQINKTIKAPETDIETWKQTQLGVSEYLERQKKAQIFKQQKPSINEEIKYPRPVTQFKEFSIGKHHVEVKSTKRPVSALYIIPRKTTNIAHENNG